MVIQSPGNLLPQLYSVAPKIIALNGPGTSETIAEPASAIHWYGCSRVACDHYVLTGYGQAEGALPSALRALEVPPTNVWALWAPDPIEEGSLRTLQAWWTGMGGSETPVPMIIGNRAELDAIILEQSLRETRRLQQSNQMLMRDLAALRESWTHHVRIPPELEDLIATLRMGRPQLIFNSPLPSADVEVPTIESDVHEAGPCLSQRLPTSARGWLGIDLHIADPGRGAGCLSARIEAADTGTVLAQWRVPFDVLCGGWLPLRLPSASPCTSRSLTLKLWASGGEVAPRLSTCSAGVMHEYQLAPPSPAQPGDRDTTMLAMKLWGGLPGLRQPASGENGPLRHDAGATVPIPAPVIGTVHLTREQSATYPVFGYMEHGKVLLRPLKTTPSAAVISLPATPGLIEISCDAMIDDMRCQTRRLGARLVVTPRGVGPDEAEGGQDVLAATDWTELNDPLAPSRLVARLPVAQNRPVDLHLFTRLPEPGPIPPHARVVFGRFEAEIHAASAWSMAAVLPVAEDRTALP